MLTGYAKLYDELAEAIDLAARVCEGNCLVSTNLIASVREARRHLTSEPVKDVLGAMGYEYPSAPPTIWRRFFLASCEISAETGQMRRSCGKPMMQTVTVFSARLPGRRYGRHALTPRLGLWANRRLWMGRSPSTLMGRMRTGPTASPPPPIC